MAISQKMSEAIDDDISALIAVQKELSDAIDALKEEFAQIRRMIYKMRH